MRFLQPPPADAVRLPRKPADPGPSPAEVIAGRQRRWDNDQAEKADRRQAAAKAETERRRQEAARLQEIQQSRQAEWARERERLTGNLCNAQAAQAQCLEAPIDLSSPESAIEAVRAMSLRDAANQLVKNAERSLATHEQSQIRR